MKALFRLLLCLFSTLALAGPAPRPDYESQVVVLVITTQGYNQWQPWEKKTPETVIAQAVVVDGPLLASTADLVEGATMVLVEKHGRPLREPARIVHVDPDANLVLLTVDTPGFFEDLRPAVLAPSMPTDGQVSTVRWRSGQLEASASRIKRIEVDDTHLGALKHAFLYVETDLSGGGWAEPLFAGGRLIGITYSQDGHSATVTPVDILRSYMESVQAPGDYREFANLELSWQINRDPGLTRYLGLEGEPQGIVVTQVPWGSSACGALFPHDILLSLDGHAIDATGKYQDSRYGRLEFTQIIAGKCLAGEVISGEVFREGKRVAVRLALRPARSTDDLMPARQLGAPPPYVIAGGFVFRELNGEYLRGWGKDWKKKAPPFLVTQYDLFRTAQTATKRRVVLLAYVLPSAYNLGYNRLQDLPVERINGRDIGSIADVEEAFQYPEGNFHRIVFVPNPVRSEAVLEAATLAKETQAILSEYRIPQRLRLPEAPLPDLGDACSQHP